ncbi:hypothetical protein Tco_1380490 [Tanacetum coccineum]
MVVFDLNQPASSLSEEDDVAASNSHVVYVSSSINTGCDSFASHDDNASYNTLTLNILNPSYMHHCHVGNPTFLNVKSNGCDDFKKAQVTQMVKIEASNLSHKKLPKKAQSKEGK